MLYKLLTSSRFFIANVLLFIIPIVGLAQNRGKIVGEVYTVDGKPLAYASIKLKGTNYGARVDENGHFDMQAPDGQYVLIVSFANYTIAEQSVQVKATEVLKVPRIIVQSASNQLREVVVSDIQKNKFARRETDDIARMPLSNMENPQAYSVVTKDFMQEIAATDYISALSQVPGAIVTNGVNDNGNGISLREFSNSGTGNSNMVRNGLPIDSRAVSEIFNLEKVEVIKGPSATLFGAQVASYGGVINNVTKRPFESFRGEVNYTTGSFGMNRLTADINAPLNEDRTALGRFNILGMTNDGFQNEGKVTAMGFATSLAFKAGEKTTVRFDADVYNTSKPLVALLRNTYNLSFKDFKEYGMPHDRSLTSNDVATNRTTINIGAEIEHRLSENWTSRTSYLYNNSGDQGSVFMVPMVVDDERIERRYRIFDDYNLNFSVIQQNFNGTYTVGGLENKVLLGLDATMYTDKNLYMVPYFAIYDTVSVKDPFWKPLTRSEIENSRGERSFGDGVDNSKYSVVSAYFSNVTNISDRLFVMLSGRLNRFQQGNRTSYSPGQPIVLNEQGDIEQNAQEPSYSELEGSSQVNFSPKIGLVFQPIKDQVAVFANYMNAFTNVAASQGLSDPGNLDSDVITKRWKPEQANQFEVGAKFDLFNGLLSSTLSFYDIRVKDRLREVIDFVYTQDGAFSSKGLEVDIIANPARGWNLMVGYGYNDNKFVKSEAYSQGLREAWSPKHVANFWTSYKFLDNVVKGLGFGAGMNYTSSALMDFEDDFTIPSYTVFHATAFYDQPKYRVGLKLNNIGNLQYWDVFGRPQKPFECLANLSFKF
ncbi:TonB-dependent receptor [Sphingobacterium deserti]|uniref:TonB-dependent siderophore receptor n=1 Tax=Sphingobacterium deserti TaxID=1229276 RepID=A0A0B8T006_9SPHI|nr:TonB-dependent receptor [Sphingobacterium deserti]KGE13401.1 TonB-dependent siderophore receptor [Sphingobacterium deserti]